MLPRSFLDFYQKASTPMGNKMEKEFDSIHFSSLSNQKPTRKSNNMTRRTDSDNLALAFRTIFNEISQEDYKSEGNCTILPRISDSLIKVENELKNQIPNSSNQKPLEEITWKEPLRPQVTGSKILFTSICRLDKRLPYEIGRAHV